MVDGESYVKRVLECGFGYNIRFFAARKPFGEDVISFNANQWVIALEVWLLSHRAILKYINRTSDHRQPNQDTS